MDLYESFGLLRAELKDIKFLCKGSKINVHTSGMSSHMSNGLVAYELTMGQPDGEPVHIFSYEESDITNDIEKQRDFCRRWADSTLDQFSPVAPQIGIYSTHPLDGFTAASKFLCSLEPTEQPR
ncbi:hypothetical protein [Pseudomonas poae]|uniref:hypothetical protein n=1 Tax=Pseudomonas poae TaxID=200451 RepID=UPI0028830480|nr:hypothetical protein [Pseudomonas poae]